MPDRTGKEVVMEHVMRERLQGVQLGEVQLVLLTASAACSFGDPCDKCYDADYYYDHPYFCQECLEEKGEED